MKEKSKTALRVGAFLLGFFICYLWVFPGKFHYDDYHSIRENSWVVSLKNVPRFFYDPGCFSRSPSARMYRPLLLLSYAIDYQIYGWRRWGWHLTNLLLHLFNSWLVWILLYRTFGKKRFAWLSIVIFALHPVSGENINYINCRSSILLLSFILLSMLAVKDWQEKKSPGWLGWALLFYVLALLVKSSAVVLPGICFLYFWIFSRGGLKAKLKKALLLLVPQIIILLGYLLLRKALFGSFIFSSHLPRSPFVNLITEFKAYFWYVGLFLYPSKVSIEHSLKVAESFFEPLVIISGVGLLLLAFFVGLSLVKPEGKFSALGFWTGFYLLMLLPTTSIVPLNVLVSERALYPALLGLVVIFAFLWDWLLERKKLAGSILLGAILLCYGGIDIWRGRVWQDEWRVWSNALENAPSNPRVLGEMGNRFAERGEKQKALRYFLRSKELLSGNPATLFNLANIYLDLGELVKAKIYLEKAIRTNPNDAEARVDLAGVYQALGKLELARYQLLEAIKRDPNCSLAYNNLGDLYYKLGDLKTAEELFKKALKIKPDLEMAHYNLGLIYERWGENEKALKEFMRAYELNPGFPDYPLHIAIIYLKKNNLKKAEEWVKKSLALDSEYGIAWYYLGMVKYKQNKRDDALKAFIKAKRYVSGADPRLVSEIQSFIDRLLVQR